MPQQQPQPLPPLPTPFPTPGGGPFPVPPRPLPPQPFPQPLPTPTFPIPQPTPQPWPGGPVRLRSLQQGCWLIRYTPQTPPSRPFFTTHHYDGTMRIERSGTNTTASGDLYYHSSLSVPWLPRRPEPNPSAGIPIFPMGAYRYYVRVTQILEWLTLGDSFTLGFELHRLTNTATNAWTSSGAFTARMRWMTAPGSYPHSDRYLTGTVRDAAGGDAGTLTMGWVSPYLRRAVVELDSVSQSEIATDNGAGTDWQDVFDTVGWKMDVDISDRNVAEPSGESWSDAEMHAALLARRDASDLDAEWRYHLLHVRRLDSTSRGIMYDAFGGDSNNVPREGAGIASHWTIPETAEWGTVKGLRFGTADSPYFRTAAHELGHALGLHHNAASDRLMNTTGVIANNGGGTFPANVLYEFEDDDARKLRHWPDPRVRPGGIPFGQSYAATPLSPLDGEVVDASDFVTLTVTPLDPVVPLGAPVRVDLRLANADGDEQIPLPTDLGLKGGNVSGQVVNPGGTARDYHPLVLCLDDDEVAPATEVTGGMTLLRGPQGALFAGPGLHTIEVEVRWEVEGVATLVRGRADIMVTEATDEAHAKAACAALSSPDLLLVLAIGGDHLEEGLAALDAAMESDVLRPHWAVVKAKQVGRRFQDRRAEVKEASAILNEGAVMSGSEMLSVVGMLDRATKRTREAAPVKKLIANLADSASSEPAEEEIHAALDEM